MECGEEEVEGGVKKWWVRGTKERGEGEEGVKGWGEGEEGVGLEGRSG